MKYWFILLKGDTVHRKASVVVISLGILNGDTLLRHGVDFAFFSVDARKKKLKSSSESVAVRSSIQPACVVSYRSQYGSLARHMYMITI